MRKRLFLAFVLVVVSSGVHPPPVAAAGLQLSPAPPIEHQVIVGSTEVLATMTLSSASPSLTSVRVTGFSFNGPDGADFSVADDYCTGVEVSSSCSFSLTFTPTRIGRATATIVATYEDPELGVVSTSAAVEGIGGPIGELCGFAAYPRTAAFQATYLGHGQRLGEFDLLRIANCGALELNVADLLLAGPDAEDFFLGPETCVGTYPVTDEPWWQSCVVDLQFVPQSPGEKVATVTVASDGIAAPHVLTVTGQALPVADLGVVIAAVAEPAPAERGGLVQYTIEVTNHGPSTAEAPFVGWWFNYPGAFETVPGDATCGPFAGIPGASCVLQLDDLGAGATSVVTASVRIGASGMPADLSASALNGSSTADFGFANNVASIGLPIADLEAPIVRFDGNANVYGILDFVWIQCVAEDAGGIDWSRTSCPSAVGPAYDFALGPQTLEATAYDLAGQRADASTTFDVRADYQAMRILTEQFVTKAGVLKDLLALLGAAARADARGNARAEAGALADYRSLLQAQSGKAVDPAAAATLSRLSAGL